MIVSGRVLILLLALFVLCVRSEVSAQPYPASGHEIRHIVPWNAGSATDIAMRGFMTHLSRHLGASIYTDNIPGGLSAVGLLQLRHAPADGYTIGTITYDVLTVEHFRLVPVSWSDFRILGMITMHPSAVIGSADRWEDLDAFLAEASGGATKLKIGNAGMGGVWHQHAVAFQNEIGLQFIHVPYSSSSGQLAALLGGEIDALVGSLPASLPYLRDGTLRILGVMSSVRDPLAPEAPTFLEQGHDLDYGSFRMVVAPKALPEPTALRLEEAIRKAWNDPDFQVWAERAAIGASWNGPREAEDLLRTLTPRVARLMDQVGVR